MRNNNAVCFLLHRGWSLGGNQEFGMENCFIRQKWICLLDDSNGELAERAVEMLETKFIKDLIFFLTLTVFSTIPSNHIRPESKA